MEYQFSPDLPFVHHLEASFPTLLAEADSLALEEYEDWPLYSSYSGSWKVFGLLSDPGAELAASCANNALRCPASARVVRRIRGVVQAVYSLMLPGVHVFPHRDDLEGRTRVHLPLHTNPEAGIRFGATGEIVRWTEGRCLLFDPNQLHEAGNLGSTPRVALLLDLHSASLRDELEP